MQGAFPRRRGGQPGNANRLVHGRYAARAVSARDARDTAWLKDVAYLIDNWRAAQRECEADRHGELARATVSALVNHFKEGTPR